MNNITKILISAAVLIIVIYFSINGAPVIDKSKIPSSSTIEYDSQYNFRQTVNDCGPYNTAAVVRALTKKEVSSTEFAKSIGWRLPNKYTLPWGLENQLKTNGIVIEVPNIKKLADTDKIAYLEEQLSKNRPVIILGETKNFEHYITLFGFDSAKNEFYAYDSFFDKGEPGLTIDGNGALPGNRILTSNALLDFWSGGGMYGIYKWYAIVASKQ